MRQIQVHRFNDLVALHTGDGATVYLNWREAMDIAAVLNCAALDVGERPFTQSRVGTYRATVDGSKHQPSERRDDNA